MKTLLASLFISLTVLISCKKNTVVPNQSTTICGCGIGGTKGWPQVRCNVKFVVYGTSIPDSVNFNINRGLIKLGINHYIGGGYYKTFLKPSLILSDSTNFCGDKNSDISLTLHDPDITKTYTTEIYVNGILITQKIGSGHITAFAQCK
jgi:hypothetical protein